MEKPQTPQEEDDKVVVKPRSTAASKRSADSVIADRMAFLSKQDDGGFSFELDAYGLAVGQTSLRLLPSQALEIAELRCAASPESVRFKIAGIRTRYKGKDYLLLQRATRIHSYGNFRAFSPPSKYR